MAYSLKEVTIRTDNSEEGMERIGELWRHIMDGRLPILFDSGHQFRAGISPVSRYSGYDGDETGSYDLTVMAVTSDFFTTARRIVICTLPSDRKRLKKWSCIKGLLPAMAAGLFVFPLCPQSTYRWG